MCEDKCCEYEWSDCCTKVKDEAEHRPLEKTDYKPEKIELSSDALTFLRNNLPMLLDMIWDAGEAPTTVSDIDDQIADLKIMREIIISFRL